MRQVAGSQVQVLIDSVGYDQHVGQAQAIEFGQQSLGLRRINGEVFNFSKQQMEDGVAAFKAVSGAKSVHEAWEVQTDFAKSALDAYVAQATKLNDLWMDAAKQAAEPFSSRFAEMTEKMQEFKAPFARAAE